MIPIGNDAFGGIPSPSQQAEGCAPSTALTQVVPDVHLPAQCPHLDDGLAQEVVRLPLEALLDAGFDVIILIPDTDFDAVGGIMALTAGRGGGSRMSGEMCLSLPQTRESPVSYGPPA